MIGHVIVLKFGGTSVGDASTIRQVVGIVQRALPRQPVVVVSAHAGVTDLLLDLATTAPAGAADVTAIAARHRRILGDLGLPTVLLDPLLQELADLARGLKLVGEAGPRAKDHLASFGERCCARTVAAALTAAGVPATAVDAFAAGLRTDSAWGRARPLPDEGRIARHLANVGGVPVVTGYIAADEHGNITTLGRNGSDYSAALFGAALGAAEIQIWKDVDGVRSADPRLVPAALPLRTMSFQEACAMASFGSRVLHPATMLPAWAKGIPVRVLSTREPDAPGTVILAGELPTPEAAGVTAIAHRANVALLTVRSQRLLPQHAFLARVFDELARAEIDACSIAVGEAAVTFAVEAAAAELLLAPLGAAGDVAIERDQAVIGVVGRGLAIRAGAAAAVLDALARARVPVRCTTQGADGSTLAVVVAAAEVAKAVRTLHDRFFAATTTEVRA